MVSSLPEKRNLKTICKNYIENMLEEITGIKAFILDDDTIGAVSVVYSRTELLKKGVFLMENIKNVNEKNLEMKAVMILRPSDSNMLLLAKLLNDQLFCEFYIFFTAPITNQHIVKLAESDKAAAIKQLQEVYLDYYCMSECFFTFNQPSLVSLDKPINQWAIYDHQLFNRTIEGLTALLLSTRTYPLIRFQKSSELCLRIADKLSTRIKEDNEFFMNICRHSSYPNFYSTGTSQETEGDSTVLLIVDRREDPVTPLLNQWTYEAMLHELLTITNGRVKMIKKIQEEEEEEKVKSDPNSQEIVLGEGDDFWEENRYKNYGELANNLKELLDKFMEKNKTHAQVDTIEQMQMFVEAYPEFRKLSGYVNKHVNLTTLLSKIVEKRKLFSISEVEQELAVNENAKKHFKMVRAQLNDPSINKLDKLRLVLLFNLRYENDDRVTTLKQDLEKNGISNELTQLVTTLSHYAGKNIRKIDLFSKNSFFTKASSIMKQKFKDVPCVYTQHQSLIYKLIDQLLNGKLRDIEYPGTIPFNQKDRASNIIVFVVGGVTYQEAREIYQLNQQPGLNITLGGTTIHNSRSFLADIQFYNELKNTFIFKPPNEQEHQDPRNIRKLFKF